MIGHHLNRGLFMFCFFIYSISMVKALPVEQVVYDSIPGAGTGGISFGLGDALGQRVHLVGAARVLTRLEVRVRPFGNGISNASQVQLSLYDATGPVAYPAPPGSLLWQGPGQTIEFDPSGGGCCGSLIIGAVLPDVHAPDTVVWTIAQIPEPVDLIISGVSGSSSQAGNPSVGSSGEIVGLNTSNGQWAALAVSGTLTARISAVVPEPSSVLLCGLLLLLGPIVFRRRLHRARV